MLFPRRTKPVNKLPKLPLWGWKLVEKGKSYWSLYTGRSFLEVLILEIDKKMLSFPILRL